MLPILYSFRRCPYAMRARLAIDASGVSHELREVALRDKPEAMLRASPKGTVPVLVLDDGSVIDESLDIMLWALRRSDPEGWLMPATESLDATLELIRHFDDHFKRHLDRYKYPGRFADASADIDRAECSNDLIMLDSRLAQSDWLCGDRTTLADMAIAPFVRQFANVDAAWFADQPWPRVRRWIETIVSSARFERIMRPSPTWKPPTVT